MWINWPYFRTVQWNKPLKATKNPDPSTPAHSPKFFSIKLSGLEAVSHQKEKIGTSHCCNIIQQCKLWQEKLLPSVVTRTPFLLPFCLREVSNSVINAKGSETLSALYRAKSIPPSFPLWPGKPTSLLGSAISQAALLKVDCNQGWKQAGAFTLQSLPFPGRQPWGSAPLLSSVIL